MADNPILTCPNCKAHIELTLQVVGTTPLPIRRTSSGRFRLTPRQVEIADLIVEGFRNREIAERLKTTDQVVKNAAREIYLKVGCNSRTELVSMVLLGTGSMQ